MAIVVPIRSRGRLDFREFDEAYLMRLRQGDPEVEAHFTSYFGQLINMKLGRRLRSREAIDDVRQETFARVLRSLPELRQAEKLGAFVYATCTNVFRELCRTRRYEELPDEIGHPAASAQAVEGLISEEQRREVQRVLDELPERERRLLRAVFFEEADRDAVCAEFHVDRDYLRVLLHRAKESFRARFRQSDNDRSPRPGPRPRPQLRST